MRKRSQWVKRLSLFLVLVLSFSVCAGAVSFPDVEGHWAKSAVERWSERRVIKGDERGFRPDDPITRAEAAAVLDQVIGYRTETERSFPDVKGDEWFAGAVGRLYAAGVLTGYEDGCIRPGNHITRQESAAVLARALGIRTEGEERTGLAQFLDYDRVSPWAEDILAAMVNRSYIRGDGGRLRPQDSVSRAEFVTILDNMIGLYLENTEKEQTGDFGYGIAVIKAPAVLKGVNLGGAVVCPGVTDSVQFLDGCRINGTLLDLTEDTEISLTDTVVLEHRKPGEVQNPGTEPEKTAAPEKTTVPQKTNSPVSGGGSRPGGSGGGGGGGGGGSRPTRKPTTRPTQKPSEEERITITFDANGGNFREVEGEPETFSALYNSGKHLGLHEKWPYREGYKFAGWYSSREGADSLRDTAKVPPGTFVYRDQTVYAGWETITYKVHFDANGGDLNGQSRVTYIYAYGNALESDMPADPVREEHEFIGWYSSQEGADKLDAAQLVATDKMLEKDMFCYAGWRRTVIRVIFDANGGSFSQGEECEVVYGPGETLEARWPELPSRPESQFWGWYPSPELAQQCDPEDAAEMKDPAVHGTRYYAGWEPILSSSGLIEARSEGYLICGDLSLLSKNLSTEKTGENSVKIQGTLTYQHDYSPAASYAAGEPPAQGEPRNGHFLAVSLKLPGSWDNLLYAQAEIAHGEEIRHFDNSNLRRERFVAVFPVTEENKKEPLVVTVDLDGAKQNTYTPAVYTIDISELVLKEDRSRKVEDEKEFRAALEDPAAEEILVTKPLILEDKQVYASPEKQRKRVVLFHGMKLPASAETAIKNIDFRTPGHSKLPFWLECAPGDDKKLTVAGNTITGWFDCVLPDVLSGTVVITDNVFYDLNPENAEKGEGKFENACITSTPQRGSFTIVDNFFAGYSLSIVYRADPRLAEIQIFRNRTPEEDPGYYYDVHSAWGGGGIRVFQPSDAILWHDISFNYGMATRNDPYVRSAPEYANSGCTVLAPFRDGAVYYWERHTASGRKVLRKLSDLGNEIEPESQQDEVVLTFIQSDPRMRVSFGVNGSPAVESESAEITVDGTVRELEVLINGKRKYSFKIRHSNAEGTDGWLRIYADSVAAEKGRMVKVEFQEDGVAEDGARLYRGTLSLEYIKSKYGFGPLIKFIPNQEGSTLQPRKLYLELEQGRVYFPVRDGDEFFALGRQYLEMENNGVPPVLVMEFCENGLSARYFLRIEGGRKAQCGPSYQPEILTGVYERSGEFFNTLTITAEDGRYFLSISDEEGAESKREITEIEMDYFGRYRFSVQGEPSMEFYFDGKDYLKILDNVYLQTAYGQVFLSAEKEWKRKKQ